MSHLGEHEYIVNTITTLVILRQAAFDGQSKDLFYNLLDQILETATLRRSSLRTT